MCQFLVIVIMGNGDTCTLQYANFENCDTLQCAIFNSCINVHIRVFSPGSTFERNIKYDFVFKTFKLRQCAIHHVSLKHL